MDLAEQIFDALQGAQLLQAMHLGDRLGWYAALDGAALSADELAQRTSTNSRYAREWLEYQTVCGILTHADGRFTLPPEHAPVLCDPDSPQFAVPMAQLSAAIGARLPDLLDAYRRGTGVSWAEFGNDAREAQAALNRPLFLHQLCSQLLPQAPAIFARLSTAQRIADLGCGAGWSCIGLAQGLPKAHVHGFDVDPPSLALAERNAIDSGVADRVSFSCVDAGTLAADHPSGGYDAVLAFECLHDVPDPVAFLRSMRHLAAPDAAVVVMDERSREEFQADPDPVEQVLYGFSVLCCLPDSMSHPGSAATGTVMRASLLREYAKDAGFADAVALPIEHEMFRFYQLT